MDPEGTIFGLSARLMQDPCCRDWLEVTQPSYPSWDTNPPSLLTGEDTKPAKSVKPNISSLSLGMTTAGSDVKIFVAPPAMQTGMYAALWASTRNLRNSSLFPTEVGAVLSQPSRSDV